MSEVIWVMDSDLCDNCGELLGDFGESPNCGWEGVDWGEEEEDDFVDFGDSDEDQEEIAAMQRVHNLFLQKLEAKYPGHPWTRKKEQ